MRTKSPDLIAAIDARLEEAMAHANYRITLNLHKKNAKIKLDQALTFAFNGGTFFIDQSFIGFIGTLINRGINHVTLLDVNSNPIEISDLDQFLTSAIERYVEATNAYMVSIRNLTKARTTKAIAEG